jgi:hypothetical protein
MSRWEAEVAIRSLQARYADICSRRAFDELVDVIDADAEIVLDLKSRKLVFTGPHEIGEFIGTSIEVFDFFQFVVRNAVIDLPEGDDPSTAAGRLWMSEFRRSRESGEWSTIFGLYHDRYRRSADGWRISGRFYHSLARFGADVKDFIAFDFPEDAPRLSIDR